MSKKQINTLFNYFQSPKSASKVLKAKENGDSTPKKSVINENQKKPQKKEDSDEEDIIQPKKRSRIQIVEDSSDSEDETPQKSNNKRLKSIESNSSGAENSPPKKAKAGEPVSTSKGRSSTLNFSFGKEKASISSKPDKNTAIADDLVSKTDAVEIDNTKDIHSNWLHNSLDFLQPHKIMDGNKRKPNDPHYDGTTLHVPESYLKTISPAMRQWWELKSNYWDTVLFFKVGKFYELYHMDAVIGVQHLGFSYMKGDFAHSGFPESAYGKMASVLVDRGFKVARCEQTETPEMMDARCKSMVKTTKFDKVVRREICQVSAKAATVFTAQMSEPQNAQPNYMFAVSMKSHSSENVRLGICFVETSIGTFRLTEFNDDKHFSKLLALLTEYPAALILYEKGGISKSLAKIFNTQFKDIRNETLIPKKQFYTASDTLEKLCSADYFKDGSGKFQWPEFFQRVADDCLPKKDYELAISSLGACLWYLKNSKIDIQVFSIGNFELYEPLDFAQNSKKGTKEYLVLDVSTISNLNLLGGLGTLQNTLDHCKTDFGQRLLHQWICRPLCNFQKIIERQKAVMELRNSSDLLQNAQNILKSLPDLERQLAKIHTYGNRLLASNHPDSRAIFYESITYSKKKIQDFVKTLKAFEKVQEIPGVFRGCDNRLLKKITQFNPVGLNIDLTDTLAYLKTAFNMEDALKEGKIIPKRGVIEEFDEVENKIDEIRQELDEYLDEQSKIFGCKVTYGNSFKKKYLLEVPIAKCHKATEDHQLEGAKKGAKPVKQFSTDRTRELAADMARAENARGKVILDINRRIFEKFSEKYEEFSQVVHCLSILDVLCSLGEYASTYSQDICVPKIMPCGDKPFISIENGRHPCIQNIDYFVPNNTNLGTEGHANFLILTGPNMGGKSTLMRQVAVISVMAQIGSFVPASSCELSLIDRIFTRLGAQDDIIQGQSTFYVELSEACSILKHATDESLVVIDELGRGTSTHDGNAIATAYVKKLTTVGCRTLFATHYHSLVDNFVDRQDIQLGHMPCLVANEEDPLQESIVFLYKMTDGRCPKSYGFNAAKLAGLDRGIVARGMEVARQLEQQAKLRYIFRNLFLSNDPVEMRKIIKSLYNRFLKWRACEKGHDPRSRIVENFNSVLPESHEILANILKKVRSYYQNINDLCKL